MHSIEFDVLCPPDVACRINFWNIPEWGHYMLYLTMAIASLIMIVGVLQRVRLWRRGKPSWQFDRLPERLNLLLTYGVRQDRINRQPYSGLMHASIFWGFTTLFIGTALATIDADVTAPWMDYKLLKGWFYLGYKVVLDIAGLFFVVALGLATLRRTGMRFPRLGSERAFMFTLALLFGINLTGLLIGSFRLAVQQPWWAPYSVVAYPMSFIWMNMGLSETILRGLHFSSWMTHMGLVAVFVAALPATNLFHSITSPLNIFFSDLKPRGALKPIPVEDVETFGAGKTEDFTWKQRLGFDACTYCGRCQAACPAMASGTMLSPKNIVVKLGFAMGLPTLNEHDLAAAQSHNGHASSNGHTPIAVNGDGYRRPAKLIGDIINPSELWSCTTCAACIFECPVFIEIVDDIIDMRRYLTMTEGEIPSSAASALTMIERSGNPWGYPAADRHAWTEELDVPMLEEGKSHDVLFWVGCSMAYDVRNQKIARSIVKILQQAGVDVALYAEETCNGDPARRLGNEYLYQAQAKRNIEGLQQYQFKKIVTGCPHCFNTLKNEYPQFGGNFEVVHHSEMIAELIASGKVKLTEGLDKTVTFHDSCYLGRYNNVYEAPREAIAATGAKMVEMPRNRERGFCCGGGGGNLWMENPQTLRVNHLRVEEAMSVEPEIVGTACPFCMTMLDDARKVKGAQDKFDIKDFAELVAERMK